MKNYLAALVAMAFTGIFAASALAGMIGIANPTTAFPAALISALIVWKASGFIDE